MAYTTIKKALIGALALSASSLAFAADKPLMMGASAKMLSDTCAGCHGTNGASAGPAIPSIGGLSTEYFVEIMQGYKSGEVISTIMGRIAKGYTDDEFTAMAGFYAKKGFVAANQKFDAAKAKNGAKLHDKYCEKCHADGGTAADDDSGVLAGQLVPYLKWTLADYRAGDRPISKKMKKKLNKMLKAKGDGSIDDLMHFYASQQ